VQYEKSLKLNPNNNGIHYKKGRLLIIGGMNEDAISEFKKALKKDPKHALFHEGLGMAYFQIKKYDDAEVCFHKAIELDPKLWEAHNFLGIIYDYKKRSEKAAHQYEAAIALKDDNELLYNNLGISYFLAGDCEKAIKAFNKALATKRAPSKTYNNLGLVLASVGKYEEALEAFRKAGHEAQAYNNLGCAYLAKGKCKEAIGCFEKAIELEPTFYATASENLRKSRLVNQSSLDSAESNFRQSPTAANFDKLLGVKQLTMQAGGSLREKSAGCRGAKPGTIHTVSKGDSLAGISRQYYGSPGHWDIIYLENSKIIGKSPKYLKVGLKLVIPSLGR
jgi:Flp pilus assembly protein TadD